MTNTTHPEKEALLIIDIQNDYFKNGAMELVGSLQAAENARRIIDRFRTIRLPVIYIQHIATRPTATYFLPGTPGAEINGIVQPRHPEKVIVKHYPNSFRETNLLEHLQALKITSLVICGMMTHMCVDATVRAARDLGFNCKVIGNACATRDLEILGDVVKAREVQKSFLAALKDFYATVVTTDSYLEPGIPKDLIA
jgi:nicotinamidase-related amidase